MWVKYVDYSMFCEVLPVNLQPASLFTGNKNTFASLIPALIRGDWPWLMVAGSNIPVRKTFPLNRLPWYIKAK